jgi:hypothetical protein
MPYQLSFQNFPKPDPSSITIDKVFNKIEELEVLDFVSKIRSTPSIKTIRLAKDLAKQDAPMLLDFHDVVRSILKTNITDDRIDRISSFKKILYKTIIVSAKYHNGRYIIKTKKVRKH